MHALCLPVADATRHAAACLLRLCASVAPPAGGGGAGSNDMDAAFGFDLSVGSLAVADPSNPVRAVAAALRRVLPPIPSSAISSAGGGGFSLAAASAAGTGGAGSPLVMNLTDESTTVSVVRLAAR